MKVFVSWSGLKSKAVGMALYEWIPQVIQAVEPYFSPEDIHKGRQWSGEIARELEEASFGIICLTRSNLSAEWLMFEAGALSKSVSDSYVVPFLCDVDVSEVQGPLVRFQATIFCESDVKKMMQSMNTALGESSSASALNEKVLDAVFNTNWPKLENTISEILSNREFEDKTPSRTDSSMTKEILGLVRAMHYKGLDENLLLTQIDDKFCSPQAQKQLKEVNIFYVGDLTQRTAHELKVMGVGDDEINEIKTSLALHGLRLGL